MGKFSEKGLTDEEVKEIRRKKGRSSKNKGSDFERYIAHLLQEWGFTDAVRSAQHSGRGGGTADIIGVPFLHIEAKAQESLNVFNAYDQAIRDLSEQKDEDMRKAIPIVVHKKNRRGTLVSLCFNDFFAIWTTMTEGQRQLVAEALAERRNK